MTIIEDSAASPAGEAVDAERGEPVALLIAEERMSGLTGVEFLARAHSLHPPAKRILRVARNYTGGACS
jgi:hypothetical protein